MLDNEAFEKHIADLAVELDLYDKILSRQNYITSNVCFSVDPLHKRVLIIFSLGTYTSRSLSYRLGKCPLKDGKQHPGDSQIWIVGKIRLLTTMRSYNISSCVSCLPLFFLGRCNRWFSSRPAIKDSDVTCYTLSQ